MAYTFNQKVKILEKLLNKLVKYSISFNKVECKIKGKSIIIEQELKNKEFDVVKIKVPVTDMDSYIKKERARLHNYKNYEPKGLNQAIEEIEVRENLKEAME
jgi:hypothetical protein